MNKPQTETKGLPPSVPPVYKDNKSFRWVAIRVSKHNIVKKDYVDLNLKEGDDYVVTHEDFINTLEDCASKRKNLEYYAITHFSEQDNEHHHAVIHCDESQVKFCDLKKWFPFSYIYAINYGQRNAIQYLVHMNNPDKEQYSWDIVETNVSNDKLENWKIPSSELPQAKIKRIVKDIISGDIKEYEVADKIEPDIYIRYNSRIKKAFDYANEKSVATTDRDMTVLVLQGPPRVGKSTFCKCWAKKHNKSICFSSAGKHAVDEYRGQSVFVFDDYNYSVTPIEDMKKLLDPHNNTGVAARYRNKSFKNVDTIFICTNTPIVEWYTTESKEDRDAFFKRISYVLDFKELSDDHVATYTVNEIVTYGETKLVETATYPRKEYHEYKKYRLESVDNVDYKFDLKKYFDVNSDVDRKTGFIHDLEEL